MEGQFLVLALIGLVFVGVFVANLGVEVPPSHLDKTPLHDDHLTQGRAPR